MSDKHERIDVSTIKDPSFLKGLSYKQLDMLSEDIRKELLRAVSTYGGHLSSNLGDVEITIALHRSFDFSKDKLIFDVGHQSYTHKILTGRSLEHLNKPGHTQGFQKIAESPYDPYEAGHSSNSISAAEGFAIARDLKGEKFDVVAFIGDSSIVNGLAFEGLNDVSARGHKIIIILNDNEMSISKSVGGMGKFFRRISSAKGYNRLKRGYQNVLERNALGRKIYNLSYKIKSAVKRRLVPLNLFDNLGFTYMGPYDGHDIKKLEKALKRAKSASKSVVLHVKTIKGKGYPFAEKDTTGYWHGVTPFDLETGKPKKMYPDSISYSHFFADYTAEMMEKHQNAFLLVPATGRGSGLEKPFSMFKDRCIDVGIAEEHCLTLAGSLYLNGYHPIVSIYSTFLQRAYDELSHDCARLNANMTLLIDRAGLVGKNGDTHQGIYDVAYLKSIPHVTVTMASSKSIAAKLYEQSFEENKGIFCIRLSREHVGKDEEIEDIKLDYLRFLTLQEGSKEVAVMGIGPAGRELYKLVANEKLDLTYIDPIYLYPIADEAVKGLLGYKNILIYDAYSTKEGFADSLSAKLMELGYKGNIIVKAVPSEFIASDSLANQRSLGKLNPEEMLPLIKETLRK